MTSHRCTSTTAVDAKERNERGSGASAVDKLADAMSSTSLLSNDTDAAAHAIRLRQVRTPGLAIHNVRTTRDVYLAFLVDSTGSMGRHIRSVKQQISAIVASIAGLGQASTYVAFVGYKDHCDGADHIDVLPFTKDVAYFARFVRTVRAKGGGDEPEDVLGGLMAAATQLPWPQHSTNVLFHIGDAPPHGRQYSNGHDSFPEGHTDDKPLNVVFGLLSAMNIQYHFGQINEASTKAMVAAFQSACLESGVPMSVFDVANPIHIAASVVSGTTMSSRSSHSSTSQRVGGASEGCPPPVQHFPRRHISFSPYVPDWKNCDLLKGSVVAYVPPIDVDALVAGTMGTTVRPITLRVAPQPFAFGSDRLVYFAQEYHKHSSTNSMASSTSSSASWTHLSEESTAADEPFTYQVQDMVAKAFLYDNNATAGGKTEGYRYMQAMECQAVAAYLARQFNHEASPRIKLCFLHAKVVRVPTSTADSYVYYGWEKRVQPPGGAAAQLKLTNNLGFVCDEASVADEVEVAVAFSHWTWHVTKGHLMVVDLQGHRTPHGLVLTDPVVHCVALGRFSSATNLGGGGMATFFQSHQCNAICRSLQLSVP